MVKIRNSLNNRSLAFSDGELVHLRPKLWQKEKKNAENKREKKNAGKKNSKWGHQNGTKAGQTF